MTTDNTQVLLFDYNNIQTDEFIDSVAKSVIAEQDDIRSKYKWTSSLTAPLKVYMESYVKAIATEHGLETHKGTPKRLEYLNKWLEQDRIFKYGQRDNFREHLARLNINAEIKSYL